MARKTEKVVASPPSLRGSSDHDEGTGGVNSPDIDPVKPGKARRRAITSAEQAHRLAEQIFNPQSQRNKMNGMIALKYADTPPFDAKQLQLDGEDWRHNFPTGFMSGIVNRIVPIPVSLIDQAKFLTSASLPEKDDPDQSKSQAFQRETTALFRSWTGWRPFIYALSQEDTLYGYAAPSCIDDDEWRPRLFRQDEFGVPDGTGQHSDEAQYLTLRHSYLIHELVEMIEDKEAAELAGWEIENAVAALNEAMPDSKTRDANNPRDYADLVREANVGMSHDAQAKTVDVYHVFAREADGKVTHWIVRKSGDPKLLFYCEDQFDKMSDVLTLFSLEPGNSKLYGSKGLGRKLINLAIAVERARNRGCDQAYLGSMMWIVGDGGLPSVQFKVQHPIGMISTDAKLTPEAIPTDLEGFLKLDERLTAYAEAAVGAYIVDKLGQNQPDQTATEAQIRDSRERAQSVAYLQRFFGQFAEMIWMMTRRACNPSTRDKEAKAYQKRLMKDVGLTREQIKALSEEPAIEVVHDLALTNNDQLVKLLTSLMANPFADQFKVTQRLTTILGSANMAKDLLLQDQFDPTAEAEQHRLQILEIAAIRCGESVNVSPRDLHPVHLKTLAQDIVTAAPKIPQAPPEAIPQLLDNLNAAIRHGEAHCQMWEQQAKAAKDEEALAQIAKYRQLFDETDKMLIDMATKMKEQQGQPGAPAPGTPPAPSPNGQAPPTTPGLPDHLAKIAMSMSYKDVPPSVQRQIESHAGFTPAYGATAENNWQAQHAEDPSTGAKIPLPVVPPGLPDPSAPPAAPAGPPTSELTPAEPAVTEVAEPIVP